MLSVQFEQRRVYKEGVELPCEVFLHVDPEDKPPVRAQLLITQWTLRPELMAMTTGRLLALNLGECHDPRGHIWSSGNTICQVLLLVVTEPQSEDSWSERVGLLEVPLTWYRRQTLEKRMFLLG
jgi:hypothetical protein